MRARPRRTKAKVVGQPAMFSPATRMQPLASATNPGPPAPASFSPCCLVSPGRKRNQPLLASDVFLALYVTSCFT
ncbi:hypothetical protein E2562_017549 [Oryza meyeriana var. granulata]|uniref:Uncharacterized protein n=1 Tax=Oryza meyeriana var. granulata TaxID=110450 RepID=A0A6G1C5G9_9ORYZ|nr:hypothetical protein E2562_017549 [Oryza meyeriana var. granulata]